jgi:hypothetical protein
MRTKRFVAGVFSSLLCGLASAPSARAPQAFHDGPPALREVFGPGATYITCDVDVASPRARKVCEFARRVRGLGA